ncbi:MAG: ParB/RepB/Spo0J family partition protein [Magnetococcales bacterium]|nr:ParB/RepB/Spo0J family partition protein [Magnetococcales bacterium]
MTASSNRLGRGLSSLLGEEGMGLGRPKELFTLAIDRISPNAHQPRRFFDEDKLRELAHSLKEKGMLQPVLVRKLADGTYQIIAGERRWRAARIAGLSEIPVIEKNLDDAETLEISLLENIQREDLNPVEQARAFERLVTEYNYSHKQIGEAVGKSRMAVSNSLRILKLPPVILQHLEQGHISAGHARALLARIEDESFLAETVERIIRENLSVREVEKMVGKPMEPMESVEPVPSPPAPPSMTVSPEPVPEEDVPSYPLSPDENSDPLPVETLADSVLVESQNHLSRRFGIPVTIQCRGRQRRIVFECDNDDTLQQIINLLQQTSLPG